MRIHRLVAGIAPIACVLFLALGLTACATPQRKQDSEFLKLVVAADRSYQRRDLGAAKQLYEQVLAAKSDYVPAHIRLGAIAYEQGDNKAAAAQFTRALEKDKGNTQARYNLALVSLDDARRLLDEYLKLQPSAPNRDKIRALLTQMAELGAK